MKCALMTMTAGAAFWSKMMQSMMSGAWDSKGQGKSQASNDNCWSGMCCKTADTDELEAKAEIRYSVRYPSRAASRADGDSGPMATIVDAVSADPRFETLAQAVTAAGLVDTLAQEGPFTVFAPTGDAFARLPEGALDDLLKPENQEKLASILTYHVAAGKLMAKDIESCQVETVNGLKATVKVTAAATTIDNAKVVDTDLRVGNGVIHVIDEVLLPPSVD